MKQKYFKLNWSDDSKHNGAYLLAEEFSVVTIKPKQVTCTGTQLVLLSLDNMVLENQEKYNGNVITTIFQQGILLVCYFLSFFLQLSSKGAELKELAVIRNFVGVSDTRKLLIAQMGRP